ncbi:hypothetical protein [Streptomyces niveus]|uniref:hypothetical protein n=1 Tax=Streptomyces niveus TaxID=193462 RepID=UPI0033C96F92
MVMRVSSFQEVAGRTFGVEVAELVPAPLVEQGMVDEGAGVARPAERAADVDAETLLLLAVACCEGVVGESAVLSRSAWSAKGTSISPESP